MTLPQLLTVSLILFDSTLGQFGILFVSYWKGEEEVLGAGNGSGGWKRIPV